MTDEKRSLQPDRLPIKLIMPKQGTERRIKAGGTPPKPFRTVDARYRSNLANQVAALRSAIVPQIRRIGSAPIRVKLISKAAAKSHRPESLFSPESCPIIGSGRLGELFVKATPAGLDRLANIIENNQSDRMTKELSCVEGTHNAWLPPGRRRVARYTSPESPGQARVHFAGSALQPWWL